VSATGSSYGKWRKSSYSNVGNCVEVARFSDRRGLRDSKNPAGHVLLVPTSAYTEFIAAVKQGEFSACGEA
jgi:hypothetical protein